MLALFLWAIFLSGIISIFFNLFNPNVPIFRYIDQESFFAHMSSNGKASSSVRVYLDRGIVLVKSTTGLQALKTEWQNGFSKKTCRFIDENILREVFVAEPIQLDGLNIASGIVVRGNYIYLTTNSASTTEPDFYVISIKEKNNPKIISKLDTGPGLVSISVAGYMAYVANTSINSQAQAIDISNPYSPVLKWSFKAPESQGTSTVLGKSIVSDGSRIFLGTTKNVGSELFSLSSDTGELQGQREINAGVNGLYFDAINLYVTTPVDPELMVFDVSTSSTFNLISQYDAPGGSGNGKSIELFNDNIFMGRTLGGKELSWLSYLNTNLDAPPMSPQIALDNEQKIGATVDGIISSNNTLYIITGHAQKELQVWKKDVYTKTLSPSQTIDLPSRAVGIGCSENYLYVAQNTAIPLLIFEANNQ